MKAFFAVAIFAVCVASTVATATAFIKIDQAVRTINKPVIETEAVVYGHRIGPAGQEMLITQR